MKTNYKFFQKSSKLFWYAILTLLLFINYQSSFSQTILFSEDFDNSFDLIYNLQITTVFAENFDDVNNLTNIGWTKLNMSDPAGSTGWYQGDGSFNSQSGAANSWIGANYNNTTGNNTISNWLIMPTLTLQNGDVLKFWTRDSASSFADRLQVKLSTQGNASENPQGPLISGDYTTLLLDINPDLNSTGYPNEFTLYSITISGLPAPTSCRIAFRYFVTNGGAAGTNSDAIGIDSLSITRIQPIPDPSASWTFINKSEPLGVASWFKPTPSGPFTSHSGTPYSYIAVNFNSTAPNNGTISNWMIPPTINLQNGDLIKFWTRVSTGSIYPDRIEVRLSTAGATSILPINSTSLGSFTTLLTSINPNLVVGTYPEVFTEFILPISGLSGPTDCKIAFRYFVVNAGTNGNYVGIDTYSIVRPILGNSSINIDNQIKVFPNPVTNELNVLLSNQRIEKALIEIIDINGRTLKTTIINDETASINTSNLSKGIYIVRITNSGLTTNQKIIKN